MDKNRQLGGVLRPAGRALVPAPMGVPHPRTHNRKRLCAGRSRLAAGPFGGVQALGTEGFLGSGECVEVFGVLHGEAGAWPRRPGGQQVGAQAAHPERRHRVLRSSVSPVTPGSGFQAVADPLVRVPGNGGGGVGRGRWGNQGNQRWASQRAWWTLGLVCRLPPLPAMPA